MCPPAALYIVHHLIDAGGPPYGLARQLLSCCGLTGRSDGLSSAGAGANSAAHRGRVGPGFASTSMTGRAPSPAGMLQVLKATTRMLQAPCTSGASALRRGKLLSEVRCAVLPRNQPHRPSGDPPSVRPVPPQVMGLGWAGSLDRVSFGTLLRLQCAAVEFMRSQPRDVRLELLPPRPAVGCCAAGPLLGAAAAGAVVEIGWVTLRLWMCCRHEVSPAIKCDPIFAAELASAVTGRRGLALAKALGSLDRHAFLLRAATADVADGSGGRRQAWLCAEFVCHNPGCCAFAVVGAGTWSGGACGACRCAWYCSTACQRQHWRRSHRGVCGAAARKLRVCHRRGCSRPATGRCEGCGVARYCGEACQRQDWKQHKPLCPQLAAWRAAREM